MGARSGHGLRQKANAGIAGGMKKLIGFVLLVLLSTACIKQQQESCSDGIKNQNEALVDCGGVCKSCPDCFDGVKNQDEDNVDCGGVCAPCPTCSDGNKNQNETGIDCGGTCEPCSTNDCNTPLGFGENEYLPNGKAVITASHDPFDPGEENESNFKFVISADFPLFYPCNGYIVTLFGLDFLKLDKNATQVLTTANYNGNDTYQPNQCFVEVFMPLAFLTIKPDQKIYITRVDNGTFNLRFCNLQNYPSTTYTLLKTNFSTNVNFTL
jgi:hypothetical protein